MTVNGNPNWQNLPSGTKLSTSSLIVSSHLPCPKITRKLSKNKTDGIDRLQTQKDAT